MTRLGGEEGTATDRGCFFHRSGTESPLLALGLISSSLESLMGSKLGVAHIFSCEIEPFKQVCPDASINPFVDPSLITRLCQAYIERNFAPPLLFRDVTEL